MARCPLLFGVLVATGLALPVTEAAACSCLPGVFLSWPLAEATGVPTDTSIVVEGYSSAFVTTANRVTGAADAGPEPLGPNEVALFEPDGDLVPLSLARQLESQQACSAGPAIAVPDRELEPETRYELHIGEVTTWFTTGSSPMPAGAALQGAQALEWQTLARTSYPTLLAMLYLPTPVDVPLFVQFQGSAAKVSALLRPGQNTALQFSVGGVECLDVDIVDLRGVTVHTETLCEIDRCYDFDSFVISSCGGNPSLYLSYEQFLSLPLGCGATPAPGEVVEPSPPPAADGDQPADGAMQGEPMQIGANSVDEGPEGCTMTATRRGLLSWGPLLGVGVGTLLVRRRSSDKCRKRDQKPKSTELRSGNPVQRCSGDECGSGSGLIRQPETGH